MIGFWVGIKKSIKQPSLTDVFNEIANIKSMFAGFVQAQAAIKPPLLDPPLSAVVTETVESARAQGFRPRYIEELDRTLRKFAEGRESRPLSTITFLEIEAWLNARNGTCNGRASPSTYNGLRARLCALCSEAVRRGYIGPSENPMLRIRARRVHHGKPAFASPNEAHDLLWVCRKTDLRFVTWLAIGMFAGVRPEELEKLHWHAIDITRKTIVIDEEVSKVHQRRIIPMEPALVEWLKEFLRRNKGEPLHWIVSVDGDRSDPKVMRRVKQFVRRHRRRLAERAGVKWRQNILRKTAATYLMALYENESKVAIMLGNSPKILLRHYRGLVHREECDAFWANTPAAVKTEPIALPKGGKRNERPGKLIP
jgi:integrase